MLWRFLDTVVLFLILSLVWPKKWGVHILIASLVLIYPGFHQQMHAFNYQVQYISRLMLLLSIYASLLIFQTRKIWLQGLLVIVSFFFAQVGYGLLDYQIGMEGLRIGLFFGVALQQSEPRKWWKFIFYSLIYLIGAGAFAYWRLFLFDSKRVTVDAEVMLSGYNDLGTKLLENLRDFVVNFYRLAISSYFKPLSEFAKFVDTKDWILGIIISLVAAGIIAFIMYRFLIPWVSRDNENGKKYSLLLILIGIFGIIGGLAPIIFSGREISSGISTDRYSYPGSISACMMIVGLIWMLKSRWLRTGLVSLLVFISVLTQFTTNVIFGENGDQTRAVWWQMSWRAPQIQPATLLSGRIHLGFLSEDYTLWAPANLIYYPENHDITITAEVLDNQTLPLFLIGNKVIAERRGIPFERDFANLLIFSKTENACLHVIDGEHPEYSKGDDSAILEVGKLSQPGRINVDSTDEPKPREDLFGKESEHDWCYFYQKGQLARQERDWQLTAQWGNEALEEGYSPNDSMEWLVFLQAFAYTGDKNYDRVLQAVKSDEYSYKQACSVFTSYNEEIGESDLALAHQQLLSDICKK